MKRNMSNPPREADFLLTMVPFLPFHKEKKSLPPAGYSLYERGNFSDVINGFIPPFLKEVASLRAGGFLLLFY